LSAQILIFEGFEAKYRCTVPLCENTTAATFDFLNHTFPHYVEVGLPKEALESGKSCKYYGISNKEVNHVNFYSKFAIYYIFRFLLL